MSRQAVEQPLDEVIGYRHETHAGQFLFAPDLAERCQLRIDAIIDYIEGRRARLD